ncbi:MAG TPA: GAF domain-containing protein [Vicinamibacterales bacterium]|nr:GAF domain-containing protein [Vicinamibacterales bacterium]
MSEAEDHLIEYFRRVYESTRTYLRDLTDENAKLCALIHTLERELDRERKDRLRFEERVAAIDAERQAYLERYLEVEAENANVSNLYVATLRLHGSIDHNDVLAAIHEIIINLVGSEELAVFELNPQGTMLIMSSSHGIDREPFEKVPLGAGIIGSCAASGRMYVHANAERARAGPEADLTVCVPLIVEGVVTGAVAIFRLLGHKPDLEPIDHELLGLIGSHAATALYCTSLVEHTGGRKSLHARAVSEKP